MIILIEGLGYEIATDYITYRAIYTNLSIDKFTYLEPWYRYVNLFFKYIDMSYETSIFFFAIITNVLFYLLLDAIVYMYRYLYRYVVSNIQNK